MKAKEKIKTQKGLVSKLRKIRDKMNLDISDMTLEEEKAYLKKLKKSSSK
ncbi:hypothetical protein QYS48_11160 [Marivirga arenosa]|uniref:Uncharacterized protein n=1 Tax=Marivirga arenosa TaxID=3059076 RepID=A0AA49GEY6_9BACT|nr:hypothetical protein [Marivirga sp. ABR2-2]WKK87287.1 hypothetical protein QYS48_11160 [Marivirga sp. ABR2-2]